MNQTRPPINPFKFGDPVEGEHYFPRPDLERFVTQFLMNRIPVVLIGPRRFGKTSFVLHVLRQLQNRHFTHLFIDIFNITSHRDFFVQLLRAIRLHRGAWERWRAKLGGLRPKLSATVDPSKGGPSLDLTLDVEGGMQKDIKEAIQDLLDDLSKLGKQVIVAIDEFQKISEIDDGGWLEATLRSHMQQLRNTSFIFTGSRRSIIYDMLNNSSRPLYKFCQPIEFPTLGDDFTDWIVERFDIVGIACSREAIVHLRRVVKDTPNYVQMICFHLVALGVRRVDVKEIDRALEVVVQKNAYAYQTLLRALTPIQQRVLRLSAIEEKQIFAKELLQKYEIPSGATLASAIKLLKEKEILDEEREGRGTVAFDDPLFAIWLKSEFQM